MSITRPPYLSDQGDRPYARGLTYEEARRWGLGIVLCYAFLWVAVRLDSEARAGSAGSLNQQDDTVLIGTVVAVAIRMWFCLSLVANVVLSDLLHNHDLVLGPSYPGSGGSSSTTITRHRSSSRGDQDRSHQFLVRSGRDLYYVVSYQETVTDFISP